MRRSLVALLLLASACATTLRAPRTTSEVEATSRPLPPLPSKAILVVASSTFPTAGVEAPQGALRSDASDLPTADPGPVVTTLERSLFEAGWTPTSPAVLARAVSTHRTAVAVRELASRGHASLLEAALLVLPSTGADSVLVVKDWRLGWSREASAQADGRTLNPLSAELEAALYDRTGTLLWQATVKVKATDVADLSMTSRWRSATADQPTFACLGPGQESDCAQRAPTAPPTERVEVMARHAVGVLLRSFSAVESR